MIASVLGLCRQTLYRPLAAADEASGPGGSREAMRRLAFADWRPPLTEELIVEAHVVDICREPRHLRFGSRRVTACLRKRFAGSGAARGVINRKRVQRIMRREGLLAPQRARERPPHRGRIELERSDQVWASDLTKIPTREGWLWLVGVIDCHDRDLIGHRYGASADAALCTRALADAVWERFRGDLDRLAAAGLELSHDWGSQYTSRRYQGELCTLQIRSRPTMIGCPEQNAIIERFFGSLKDEEVWTKEYETRAEAIEAIDAWIDFYRSERPHQALDYRSPLEHRAALLEPTCAHIAA